VIFAGPDRDEVFMDAVVSQIRIAAVKNRMIVFKRQAQQ